MAGNPPGRCAFIISNKAEKSAVKRNATRRQMREIIRLQIDQIKPGFDMVFIPRSGFLLLSYQEKKERVIALLKKAHLF